ncbi:MAG: acyloxyacyl hydrolase [Chromatiales bacterium]
MPVVHLKALFVGRILIYLLVVGSLSNVIPRTSLASDLALTLFGGRITGVSAWHDIVAQPDDLDWQDGYLAGGALAYTLSRFQEDALSLELEGQAVWHYGDQHLWEFNLPLTVRWHKFPWNHRVATTAAFGLGPSYTTEVPPLEVELEGDSQQFLYYWFIGMTFGPPDADWTTSWRLHHRSGGFGTVADEGGYNALTFGIRFSL